MSKSDASMLQFDRLKTAPAPSRTLPWFAASVALLFVVSPRATDAQEETAPSNTAETAESDAGEIDDLPEAKKEKLLELLQTARDEYSNGNYEEVVPRMKRAYELHPDPEFLFRIALSHERMENTDSAIRYYKRYLDEKPDTDKRGRVERSLTQLRDDSTAEDGSRTEDPTATAESSGEEQSPVDQQEASAESSRTLPIALTAAGAALALGSVTFGILSARAKSDLDSLYHEESEYSGFDKFEQIEQKTRQKNLYTGLAVASGLAAAGSLAWAVVEWTSGSTSTADLDETEADESEVSATSAAPLRVRLELRPTSVALTGSF